MMNACAKSLGLAWFLRKSLEGADLQTEASTWMQQLNNCTDAGTWRDAALALMSIGQLASGLNLLQQALLLNRHFVLPHPPEFKKTVLMLMTPGELSANTPIECLLESTPVKIIQSYVQPLTLHDNHQNEYPLQESDFPDHDILWMAIAESPANQPLLHALIPALARWSKPVVNAPKSMLNIARDRVAQLLRGVDLLLVPHTQLTNRTLLQNTTLNFPFILRPAGSQGGQNLERLENRQQLTNYLDKTPNTEFYQAPFVDYRNADGLYGKMRIALLNGQAWPCHYAFSKHWMVHYVHAGMYNDAQKRLLEQCWMEQFDSWNCRYRNLWPQINQRLGLSYVLLDLAELPDGRLLLFEADPAMVVHRMDSSTLFPYKDAPMQKLQQAVLHWLCELSEISDES